MDTKDAGRLGGQVRSDAKAAAARQNGKLGGRPRKQQPQPQVSAQTAEPAPHACRECGITKSDVKGE